MHSLCSLLAAAFFTFILPPPLEAATVSATASCKSVFDAGGTTYAAFTGCFVDADTSSFNGTTFNLNDHFSDTNGKAGVETLVDLLFTDTTGIIGSGTFSPGPGDGGNEFNATRQSSGFTILSGGTGGRSVTMSSLPTGTIFVSLKHGNGYDLFGLYGSASPFAFTSSADISHVSTFAGVAEVTPIPIPGTGLLLLGGLGGLAALRRRRRQTSNL